MSEAPGVVVIGAGIAGLSVALRMAPHPVTVLTGAPLGEGAATAWAQGGIAAALGPDDAPAFHMADTIAAGAGCVAPEVAAMLAEHAGAQISWLEKIGVAFDRDTNGKLLLGREAAHSRNRIVHAGGDSTGAAVMQALIKAAKNTPSIAFRVGGRAVDIQVTDGVVTGLYLARNDAAGEALEFMPASAVVLATGGIGQLYAYTTNPPSACGEGLAMAARAGAVLRDLEFVQFHPTALSIGADPMPLLTEALRGDGAVLVNETGARFMLEAHPDAELAPRDVVARGIFRQLKNGHRPMLDATRALGARFPEKFPFIYETCRKAGLDPVASPLPVMAAAHYHMGGIAVDAQGESSLKGLFVCGEAASTGVHGANRLASNSLLEALVYAEIIAGCLQAHPPTVRAAGTVHPVRVASKITPEARLAMRRHMFDACGLVRNAAELDGLLKALLNAAPEAGSDAMYLVAAMVTLGALTREESRGSHCRSDFPELKEPPAHQTITFATFQDALYKRYGKRWPTFERA